MSELYAEPHFRDLDELADIFFPSEGMPRLDQKALHKPEVHGAFPGTRNAHGYRADEFSERGDFNIVYLGCSWVEGIFIPRGTLFSDQVARLLTEETGKSVRSWNCGLCGTGIDYITRLLPNVLHCLKPDLVVLVISTLERRENFLADGRRHWFLGAQPNALRNGALKLPRRYWPVVDALQCVTSDYENAANFLRHFRLASLALDACRTPWLFSSLPACNATLERLMELRAISHRNYLGHAFERIDAVKPGNAHPGPLSHRRFAEAIANRILATSVMDGSEQSRDDGGFYSSASDALSNVWRRAASVRSKRSPKHDDGSGAEDIYPLW